MEKQIKILNEGFNRVYESNKYENADDELVLNADDMFLGGYDDLDPVEDECLEEGEIGRTAGRVLGSKFGLGELGSKIGDTIEDTAKDAYNVYKQDNNLSDEEAIYNIAQGAKRGAMRAAQKVAPLAKKVAPAAKKLGKAGLKIARSASPVGWTIPKSVVEAINEHLGSLNEAEMSDEDKKDSEVLRNIVNKSLKRSNAKLTQEEKDILDKYGLFRDSSGEVRKQVGNTVFDNEPIVRNNEYDKRRASRYNTERTGMSNDKINLADRARKLDDRGHGNRQYANVENDRYLQNAEMQQNYNGMKSDLSSRKYHQDRLDDIDTKYDAEEAELQKRLDALKKRRESDRKYYSDNVDSYQSKINKRLKKESVNEALLDRDWKDLRGDVYNALSKIMFKWDRKNIELTPEDMDKAYEWFAIHFFEDELPMRKNYQ